MKINLSVFAQYIRLIPRDIIHKNVDEHDSDFNSKGINSSKAPMMTNEYMFQLFGGL